jgi:hypothetical protein
MGPALLEGSLIPGFNAVSLNIARATAITNESSILTRLVVGKIAKAVAYGPVRTKLKRIPDDQSLKLLERIREVDSLSLLYS